MRFLTRVALPIFAAFLTLQAAGQAISVNGGSVQGAITDASGAKVAGATVTVSSPQTGYSKTLTTDSAGFYSVGPLNPGPYHVQVSAGGFRNLDVTTVVRTGTVTPGDFKLAIGQASETVEVNAGAIQVNTDQIAVSDVITREQVQNLPVNGRNFLDVAQIEPGVILQQGSSFDPTKTGYSAISVSGVSGRTTRILLDGQDITDEFVGTTMVNVSQGAVDEFQLNRSTQDISGDVTSTGQVLVSTQSGTNSIHGQGFYYFQDARALFANGNFGGTNPPFQRNQFGGSLGSPVIKDKLFVFLNAERIQQKQSAPLALGPVFAGSASSFGTRYSTYTSPYKETYETGRVDYNGPKGTHFFARGLYNYNGSVGNFGHGYELYTNHDNTWGIAGGADFVTGRFTHSFRGGYLKFHNLIADDTQGNSGVYNPLPALTLRYSAQNFYTGPNWDAPQGTFQSDKQLRYDGTWTRGSHLIKFGVSMNRVQSAAFAAFFGLAPRLTISASTLLAGTATNANPLGLGCNGVAGAAACPSDPLNGYDTSTLVMGNNLGYATEVPAFNLPGGGGNAWRIAGYVGDTWKVRPSFTLTAGVRYSVDTNRENNDLAPPACSTVAASLAAACAGQAPGTSIFSLFNSSFTGKVRQPYNNIGPQAGFNYTPDGGKTSLRGGAGIYFENVVFNNTQNARSNLLQKGPFFGDLTAVCSSYSATFPDGTVHTTSPDGTQLQTLCQKETVTQSAPQFIALQQQYQANTQQNMISTNGPYVGNTLTVNGLYSPNFTTPYSEQFNFTVERKVFSGAVITASYVHNATLHIGLETDVNHVGAARTFNATNAQAAVTRTIAACAGGATVTAIIAPGGCPGLHAGGGGATISDFAKNGLDSGVAYNGNNPYVYSGKAASAFPGINQNLGTGLFIQPAGKSGYDALQLVYRQQLSHNVLGVLQHGNMQVSYSLSKTTGTSAPNAGSTVGNGDEFFTGLAWDYDHPTAYMGRLSLDHTHELNMGGSFNIKYGPQIGIIGHFYSAPPSTLTLDTALTNGGIFQTDVTGDGTVGDPAPGTLPGSYMHEVKGQNLQSFITNFNATQAGKLTPAGQAVVGAGLLTAAQMVAIGGAIQPIANLPNGTGLNIPAFRSLDLNVSYPIHFNRVREGLSLEPAIAFYNVGNFSNFYTLSPLTTILYNATTGPSGGAVGPNNFASLSAGRTQRGTGTFDQGAPRSVEFQLKLNF